MQTEYTLEVYGYLWSGPRAVYSYRTKTAVESDAAAKQIAGDFSSLIDWRCVRCTSFYESLSRGISRRVDEYKTLRGFRNGMSPRRFYRLANGM